MNTLDFARKFIRFDQSSPITGAFRDEMYPFLRKPMEAADDIRVKRLVIFKASSCLGTVLGQIINLKRIVCDVGSQLMVCQTDDDATTWAKTRGKEWIKSNPDAMRLLSKDKYAITNDLWLFRHKFLGITGPGINAAQSVQVRYVQTDETHLLAYPQGRIVEFEKRMGGRWDRQATHITTAPDERDYETGDYREVHGFYLAGQQDEWNFRCPKCAELITPLWAQDSREKYDLEVFQNVGDEVEFVCPHCANVSKDTSRDRYALVREGDYVAQNPSAPIATRSFQWPVFAAHWISWREMRTEHEGAMAAARMGNLKPLEDWRKKRECRAWVPILPDFGDGKGANDYKMGDVWECGESELFAGIDRQAGKGDEGEHLWVLIVRYAKNGDSRRVAYCKCLTFSQVEAVMQEHGVKPENVYVDSGYENRSTFRECGKRKWFTVRGSDEVEFLHVKRRQDGTNYTVSMPYSQGELQSGIIGQKPDKEIRQRGRGVPEGWAWQFVQCNPTLYGYLSACIGGKSRYFGIASDFPDEYKRNIPSFIQVIEKDKHGRDKKPIWKPVRETHPHDCEIAALVGAIRAGYFPLAGAESKELKLEESL